MFKEFDGDDAVEYCWFKFIVHDIASDDVEVVEAFGFRDAVDVQFLSPRVGEGCDFRVGEDFGEVEGC